MALAPPERMERIFSRIAERASDLVGSHWAFILAGSVVIVWAVTGPIFGFSDTWQLVINTGTTIVTFIMVFLIQNTQNRDAEAMHIKLDELIRAVQGAENTMIGIEHKEKSELDRERERIEKHKDDAKRGGRSGAGERDTARRDAR
jgi:low affinity Fe/Cu permease